jgi:hypothetical protein
MYTVLPEIAMKPADAYDQLVRGDVEAVSIDALAGRIAAVMLVPYPPGIPLIMPGERFTESTRSIIDYLAFARTFDSSFPRLCRGCSWVATRRRRQWSLLHRRLHQGIRMFMQAVMNPKYPGLSVRGRRRRLRRLRVGQ